MPPGQAQHGFLDAYPVFATARVDVAEHHVGRLYAAHRMQLVEDAQFQARVNGATLGSLLVAFFSFSAPTFIDCPEVTNCYVVNLPVGRSRMPIQHFGRSTVAHQERATVFSAGESCTAEFLPQGRSMGRGGIRGEPYHMWSVRLDEQVLMSHLSRMLGAAVRDRVRFDVEMDVNRGGSAWRGALALAARMLSRPGGLRGSPLVAAELEHNLYTTLLLSQPHNYSADLRRPRSRGDEPRAVQIARELIESSAQLPHTVGTLAEAAGVSVRTLEAGFRRTLGMPPSKYLRHVRLERVHAELDAATAEAATTVTQVAMRWGFWHTGRFAAAYRQRYGVTPSQTLRAARQRNG